MYRDDRMAIVSPFEKGNYIASTKYAKYNQAPVNDRFNHVDLYVSLATRMDVAAPQFALVCCFRFIGFD
jgi:hypothetical protein